MKTNVQSTKKKEKSQDSGKYIIVKENPIAKPVHQKSDLLNNLALSFV